jgi:hypothetical protein
MVMDDELVVAVDAAEDAGKALERQVFDVETDPGAARTKPPTIIVAQFRGRNDQPGGRLLIGAAVGFLPARKLLSRRSLAQWISTRRRLR